jgi:hypothetical protein
MAVEFEESSESGFDLSQSKYQKFLKSGVTGAELARNPSAHPEVAEALQYYVDRNLALHGSVPNIEERGGEFSGTLSKQFVGTSTVSEFHSTNVALRQEFVDAEIERQFGPQNITSQTSTAAGQIPGQGSSTTPTAAERDAIAAGFQTPLQLRLAGKPANVLTPPRLTTVGPRDPTIVTGAGVRRRRAQGKAAQTILTSDADALTGSETLLG